MIVETIIE